MQLRLKGSGGSSELLTVNRISGLPTNGGTQSFLVGSAHGIGDFRGLSLSVDDSLGLGYCVKSLSLTMQQNVSTNMTNAANKTIYEEQMMHFDFAEDFFGSGLILSTECDYSFRYMGEGRPMLQCLDYMLELDM